MATRTVHDCDVCGQEKETREFWLLIGTHYDGVETVQARDSYDLCLDCTHKVLADLATQKLSTLGDAAWFSDRVKYLATLTKRK